MTNYWTALGWLAYTFKGGVQMRESKLPAVPPVVLSDANRGKIAQMIRRTTHTKPLKVKVAVKKK